MIKVIAFRTQDHTFYLFALNTDFSLELLLYQKLKPPLTKINLKIKKNTPTLNSVTPI